MRRTFLVAAMAASVSMPAVVSAASAAGPEYYFRLSNTFGQTTPGADDDTNDPDPDTNPTPVALCTVDGAQVPASVCDDGVETDPVEPEFPVVPDETSLRPVRFLSVAAPSGPSDERVRTGTIRLAGDTMPVSVKWEIPAFVQNIMTGDGATAAIDQNGARIVYSSEMVNPDHDWNPSAPAKLTCSNELVLTPTADPKNWDYRGVLSDGSSVDYCAQDDVIFGLRASDQVGNTDTWTPSGFPALTQAVVPDPGFTLSVGNPVTYGFGSPGGEDTGSSYVYAHDSATQTDMKFDPAWDGTVRSCGELVCRMDVSDDARRLDVVVRDPQGRDAYTLAYVFERGPEQFATRHDWSVKAVRTSAVDTTVKRSFVPAFVATNQAGGVVKWAPSRLDLETTTEPEVEPTWDPGKEFEIVGAGGPGTTSTVDGTNNTTAADVGPFLEGPYVLTKSSRIFAYVDDVVTTTSHTWSDGWGEMPGSNDTNVYTGGGADYDILFTHFLRKQYGYSVLTPISSTPNAQGLYKYHVGFTIRVGAPTNDHAPSQYETPCRQGGDSFSVVNGFIKISTSPSRAFLTAGAFSLTTPRSSYSSECPS